MLTPSKSRFAGFLLAASILCAAPLCATQVELVSGEVIEGEITQRSDSGVTIRTITNTLTIPRSRIKDVRESAPGSLELTKAKDFLKRKDIAKAKDLVEQAQRAGGDPKAIAGLIEQIRQEQAKDELTRYSALIESAKATAAKGQDSPALTELRALLDTTSDDSPARKDLVDVVCAYHMARANEFRDKVKNQQAVDELKEIVRLDPTRAQPYFDMADIFKNSSATWTAAIESYRKGVEVGKDTLNPKQKTRANWEMAELYRQQFKWREASTMYREAYLQNPQFELKLTDRLMESLRAYTQEQMKINSKTALAIAEEGLKVRKDPDLLMMKGELLHNLQRYDESTTALEGVIEAQPRTRMANYLVAQNYLAKNETLKAREYLQKEIDSFPNNYDALCELGDLGLERDDYDAAVDYFTKARGVDKDLPRASLGVGRAFRQRKQLEKAREMVSEVLARLPEDREAHLEMGKIYLDEKNLDMASEYFSAVLDLIDKSIPTNDTEKEELVKLKADALIARGEISLLTAGPGTANQDFLSALKVLPDYGQAYFSIGNAFRRKYANASPKRLDDLKEAEKNMLKARELMPSNPQFALELGILYAQELAQGDAPNQKEYLDKAAKSWHAYIDLGGANAAQVETWIAELGNADPGKAGPAKAEPAKTG